MLEKRILKLSPIGKKLGVPYRVLGGHLGFWALDPTIDRKCCWRIIYYSFRHNSEAENDH